MLLFQKSIRVKSDTMEWKYQLGNVPSPESCYQQQNFLSRKLLQDYSYLSI